MPEFQPSESDWSTLAKAYGFALSPDDRQEISRLVQSYFDWQPFEQTAPFLDDSLEWIKIARKKGISFWQHLLREGSDQSQLEQDAAFYAKMTIDNELRELDRQRGLKVAELISEMTLFMAATKKAADRMIADAGSSGYQEGRTWEGLIVALAKWFEETGRPVTASKGTAKAKHDRPSPFVALVLALQDRFPANLRRHNSSPTALAQAIGEARRRAARKLKSAKSAR